MRMATWLQSGVGEKRVNEASPCFQVASALATWLRRSLFMPLSHASFLFQMQEERGEMTLSSAVHLQ